MSTYLFQKKEKKRIRHNNTILTQENIDNAFSKRPRRTAAYDKIDNHIVILLESNNTNSFGIIKYNGYNISSINRAFVEMITNIHYFQSMKM